jgi:hypothetical protein
MAREALMSSYEDLEALRIRFEEFRSGHEKRTRLPEELWRAAGEVAGRRGMNVVCRSLRLDADSLKKWMGQDAKPAKAKRKLKKHKVETAAHFVELFTPAAGSGSACIVEVESSQGGKLRLEWKGVSASEVTQLIRTFAGE